MRRFRSLLLIALALVLLIAFHVYTSNSVRVKTIPFESNLVGKSLPYTVVLPPGYTLITSGKKYPVLYLLHGWGGNPEGWIAQTKLTDYAARYQLIIVLPEGGNNWYTDSATAPAEKYESYLLQELMADVDNRFRTIRERKARAIAGFSMGGYGALKFGIKHPDVFIFAASMSGAFDAPARVDDESIMRTFGAADNPVRSGNDLSKLAGDVPDDKRAALPFFYFDCGTEDPWLKTNRDLDSILHERKIAHDYREFPGGHDWKYWDKQVQDILRQAAERLVPAG
jgi:S-formylglutathione hydrolase FrmB